MAQTIKLKRSGTSGATPTTSQLELGEVAINTYDGKMYIKKNVSGTESIVEVGGLSSVSLGGLSDVTISSAAADQLLQYNGSEWVNVSIAEASAIMKEYQFTATAGQSTFSGSDDNSETLSYTAGAIQVFLNGIFLDSAVDYTATNGTSIVLSETVDANDYLQVVAFKKKIGDGNVSVDTFTGNNSTTAFTLSVDPGDENNTRVFIDGVYQSKDNYSVSGTTLTFSTPPPTDTAIEIEIGNRVVTLDTLSDLDLPDNVKLRLGTSQDLEIFHDGTRSIINDAGTGDLQFQVGGSAIFDVTTDGIVMEGFPESSYEIKGDIDGGIRFTVQAGEALSKGDVVYISGAAGDNTVVSKAQANSASTMPAFGLMLADTANGGSGQVVTFGNLYGSGSAPLDTSALSVGDTLYVSATTAGGYTTTIPTGESSLIQNIGKVVRSNSNNGAIKVGGAGRTNATPNLDDGDIFIGNSSNQAVSASLNTKIEDYLDGGTSTASFASLTFDNYTLDSNKIATNQASGYNGDILLDAAGDIILDAAGNDVILKDNGTTFGQLTNDSGNLVIYNSGSQMLKGLSTGSNARFMGSVGIGADPNTYSGFGALTLNGSSGSLIDLEVNGTLTGEIFVDSSGFGFQTVQADDDIIFKGNDGGSTITALTLDMSEAGAATFNAGSTFSGNLAITAGSGQRYIEIASGTSNAKTYRIYNGISWNPDALLIYNHTDDNTVLTIEPNKLGVNRGANSLSHTLDVGGNIAISGTEIVTTSRTITNIASLTVTGTNANLTLGTSGNDITFGRNADNYINAQAGTSSNIVINPENRFVVNTSDTERMRIDSSGRVGIGTSSPSAPLHVDGSARFDLSSGENLYLYRSSASNLTISLGSANTDISSAGTINFKPEGTTIQKYQFKSADFIVNGPNVGIGTTSPATKLEVAGTAPVIRLTDSRLLDNPSWDNVSLGSVQFYTSDTSSPGARVGAEIEAFADGDSASAPNFNLLFKTATNTGTATEKLRIDKDGRVGIGTTSPVQALDVVGSIQTDTAFRAYDSVGGAYRNVLRYDSGNVRLETGTGSTARELGIWTAGTERIRVDTSGNVGIGTTSPAAPLHVKHASGEAKVIIQAGSNTSSAVLQFGDSLDSSRGGIEYTSTDDMAFSTNNMTEAMRIRYTGNVGIGTSSPDEKLEVSGGVTSNFYAFNTAFSGSPSDSVYVVAPRSSNLGLFTASTERLTVDGSGNVGIGTTSPNSKLEVATSANVNSYSDGAIQVVSSSPLAFVAPSNLNPSLNRWGFTLREGGEGHFGIRDYRHSSTRVTIDDNGYVGIGTTSPQQRLDVEAGKLSVRSETANTGSSGVSSAVNNLIHLRMPYGTNPGSAANAGARVGIKFSGRNDGAGYGNDDGKSASIYGVSEDAGAGYARKMGLAFYTSPFDANQSERLRIDADGKVGIGTTSPDAKLQVAGTTMVGADDFGSYDSADGNLMVSNGSSATSILLYNDASVYHSSLINYHNAVLSLGLNNANTTNTIKTDTAINVTATGVGIGTTSPGHKLSFGANIPSDGKTITVYEDGNIASGIGVVAGVYRNFTNESSVLSFGHYAHSDGTTYTERMRITSGGVVGIGTSAPNSDCMLEVKGLAQDQYPIIRGTATSGGSNNFNWMQSLMHPSLATDKRAVFVIGKGENARNSSHISHYHKGGDGSTSNGMAFGLYDANDLMFIQATGNVGIGTTSPAAKLEVRSAGSEAGGAEIRLQHANNNTNDVIGTVNFANNVGSAAMIQGGTSGANNSGYISFHTDNAGSSSEKMRIDSSGNLLVGTTAAVGKFSIEATPTGTARSVDYSNTGGTVDYYVVNNVNVGSISVSTSATAYNTSSDQRLKDNIVDAPSASDDIDAIQVRSFDWKADGSHQKYGMVAQELQSVAPEAVSGDADSDDMMGVDYSKLVPMLVKALQESRQEINNLKSRVEELESQ